MNDVPPPADEAPRAVLEGNSQPLVQAGDTMPDCTVTLVGADQPPAERGCRSLADGYAVIEIIRSGDW